LANAALDTCVTPEEDIIDPIAVSLNTAFDFVWELTRPFEPKLREELLKLYGWGASWRGEQLETGCPTISVCDDKPVAFWEYQGGFVQLTVRHEVAREAPHVTFLRGKKLSDRGGLVFKLPVTIIRRIYYKGRKRQLPVGHQAPPEQQRARLSL
jgi:hypothetical protein